jgi:hypothetical protein
VDKASVGGTQAGYCIGDVQDELIYLARRRGPVPKTTQQTPRLRQAHQDENDSKTMSQLILRAGHLDMSDQGVSWQETLLAQDRASEGGAPDDCGGFRLHALLGSRRDPPSPDKDAIPCSGSRFSSVRTRQRQSLPRTTGVSRVCTYAPLRFVAIRDALVRGCLRQLEVNPDTESRTAACRHGRLEVSSRLIVAQSAGVSRSC